MAIREVLKMGNPLLREVSRPMSMEEITSEATKDLVKDMIETMHHEEGIGLAAPQIGINKQLAIIGIPENNERYPDAPETKLIVVINPEVEVLDSHLQGNWEGCLSVPGLRGYVERPQKILVNYHNLDGDKEEVVLEGFVATVFQHEIDHLFGTLYIDKIKDTKLLSFVDEFVQFHAPKND